MPLRTSFCVNGSVRNSHCSSFVSSRSGFGMIHGGVRWNSVSSFTRGAICGTN